MAYRYAEFGDIRVAFLPHLEQSGRGTPLIYQDDGRRLHRDFYRAVGRHVKPGGSVLLQENAEDSSVDDFVPMIRESGLELVGTLPCEYPDWGRIYYVWSRAPAT